MAYYKYTGTYVYAYPTLGITASPGVIYDLDPNVSLPDSNWQAVSGPATPPAPSPVATVSRLETYLGSFPGKLGPASTRCSWHRNTEVSDLAGGTNYLVIPIADASQDMFLPVFSNSFGEESVGANAITIACSIIGPDATRMPYTFGGAHTVTIAPGGVVTPDRPLFSSQMSFTYAAGAGSGSFHGIALYVYVIPSGGTSLPLNMAVPITNSEIDGLVTTGPVDKTLPGSGSVTTGNNAHGYTFGPVAVLGSSRRSHRLFGAIGDSIMQGHGDTPDYVGYLNRGFYSQGLPLFSVAVSGERAQDFVTPKYRALRAAMLNGVTDVVIGLGVNDFASARTVSQIQTDLSAIYAWAANNGMRVHALTVTPMTTSTDSWATTGNQTSTITPANLAALNGWMRSLPPNVYGVIDVASQVSTNQDSGIWKAPSFTADGTHPTATVHQGVLSAYVASYLSGYTTSSDWAN